MKYSLPFRLWHWLNALVVLGLLGTILLRKTFLSWKTNSEIIINQLAQINIAITEVQAKVIAKAIRAGMWEWHIILGYALAFLILYRVILFFKDTSIKTNFQTLSLHKKAVHSLYYLFYFVLLFMSVSGFAIHFYQELGFTKDFTHDIKEIHELVFNFIWFFAAVHIAGVVIADNTEEKGLISTMINGKE